MKNHIYQTIEQTRETISGAFPDGRLGGKLNGAIAALTFKRAIEDVLAEAGLSGKYKVSGNNVYISGLDTEFDLLLLKAEACEICGLPLYDPADVVAVLECKASGIFSIAADGTCADLKKLTDSYNFLVAKNPNIRLGYMTVGERIPVKQGSKDFWEATQRCFAKSVPQGYYALYADTLYHNPGAPVHIAPEQEWTQFVLALLPETV